MSKCGVCRTLKWKFSHWTLLRPKYWAWVGMVRKKRTTPRNARRLVIVKYLEKGERSNGGIAAAASRLPRGGGCSGNSVCIATPSAGESSGWGEKYIAAEPVRRCGVG